MKISNNFLSVLFFLSFLVLCSQSFALQDPLAAANFNPKELTGLWYDIGHSPNFFQNFCDNSTAEFIFQNELQISVLLTCYRNKMILRRSQGLAKIMNPGEPDKFFVDIQYLPRGDYRIIMLDPQYLWAVMSSPNKSTFFIIARQVPMDSQLKFEILRNLQSQDFDISRIVFDKY